MTSDRGATASLQLVGDAAAALARSGDLDSAVETLLGLLAQAVGADVAIAYLQDPDRADLQLGVAIGLDQNAGASLEAGLENPEDPVIQTARDRTARDLGGGEVPAVLAAAGAAVVALRPLDVSRGGIDIPVGVVALAWREQRPLTPDEDRLVAAMADLTAVAIDRARLASMLVERSEWFERMAHTDPLTGLANQRTFSRILELELARAARQSSEISIAVFDVDGMTAINQMYGHEAGDDVLRTVASVLAESVRLVDTVARYGGDEFVLIAPGSAGATVARRVLDGVQSLPAVAGVPITVSVGVARFPNDGVNADELLDRAQDALRAARAAGPGGIAAAGVEAEATNGSSTA
jgi:diguanylate cyclase (GGDEF)-like protein